MGDHTEAIQVEFDPKKITFKQILDVITAEHNPHARVRGTQYKSVLWTHGEAQAKAAAAWVAALEKKNKKQVTTEVRPAERFWIAEDYHQKYYLRGRDRLVQALFGARLDDEAFRNSTLAARVNGWLTGGGTAEEIEREVKALGLGDKQKQALKEALGKRAAAICR